MIQALKYLGLYALSNVDSLLLLKYDFYTSEWGEFNLWHPEN